MADWSHETRRYIYRTPDPRWLAMRASYRALAAELLRWVDDDGAIYLRSGEDPWRAVSRLIQAGPEDRTWVQSGVRALLADGHLTTDAGEDGARLLIRNFKTAQGIIESADALSQRRARDAERKARERAAKRNQLQVLRGGRSEPPSAGGGTCS